jgi:hypothetical protein
MPEGLLYHGAYLGSKRRNWTNESTGEKGSTLVLVFRNPDPLEKPYQLNVGKDYESAALSAFSGLEGSEVTCSVFVGHGRVWFSEIAA